jgi:hypothetical protein
MDFIVITLVTASLGQTFGFEDTAASRVTRDPLLWRTSVDGSGQTGPVSHFGFAGLPNGDFGPSGVIAENSLTPPASLFVAPRTGLRAFYALPGRLIERDTLPFPQPIGTTVPVSQWSAPNLQTLRMWIYLPGTSPTRRFASRIFSSGEIGGFALWWQDPAQTIPTIPDFYREFTVPTNQWTQIDLSTPFGQIRQFQLFGLTDTGGFDSRPYAIDDITAIVPTPSGAALVGLSGLALLRRRR